jgi:hypothetical protein
MCMYVSKQEKKTRKKCKTVHTQIHTQYLGFSDAYDQAGFIRQELRRASHRKGYTAQVQVLDAARADDIEVSKQCLGQSSQLL